MHSTIKNYGMFALRLGISLVALYYVFTIINTEETINTLLTLNPVFVAAALLVINTAHIISALRLRYYVGVRKKSIGRAFAISLYYVGMLFNRVLPSGLGGDGYIMYKLNKRIKLMVKDAIQAVLSCRASGLLVLLLIIIALLQVTDVTSSLSPFPYTSLYLTLTVVITYTLGARVFLSETVAIQSGGICYSAAIQGGGAVAMLLLCYAAGIPREVHLIYVMIFMVSAVLILLPISIGGAGIRELVFLSAAVYFGISAEKGVALALSYFTLDLISSLVGLVFWNRLDKMPVTHTKDDT